jgi:hypothetical protein
MITKSAALPNPPELKVRGSNPLGHAISNHTICNDFGAVSRVNARSLAQSKLRPDASKCAVMTRVLLKVRGKFQFARSGASGDAL